MYIYKYIKIFKILNEITLYIYVMQLLYYNLYLISPVINSN